MKEKTNHLEMNHLRVINSNSTVIIVLVLFVLLLDYDFVQDVNIKKVLNNNNDNHNYMGRDNRHSHQRRPTTMMVLAKVEKENIDKDDGTVCFNNCNGHGVCINYSCRLYIYTYIVYLSFCRSDF